ncbi:MAG: Parallel beta-helix repeat protein [Ignavibacteria bacterium]|nr:Parallel beta-helix repeat protein [Ignavibacteria bacterium]
MKHLLKYLTLLLTILIVSVPLQATTFYVDKQNGNDVNPGTFALPWKSLQYAIDRTNADGHTINLKNGGTFQDSSFVIGNGHSNLIINGTFGGNQVIMDGGGSSSTLTAFTISGSAGVNIRGFNIRNYGNGKGIRISGGNGYHILYSNTIQNCYHGIYLDANDLGSISVGNGSTNINTISSSTFGIYFVANANTSFYNSYIKSNIIDGCGTGIYIQNHAPNQYQLRIGNSTGPTIQNYLSAGIHVENSTNPGSNPAPLEIKRTKFSGGATNSKAIKVTSSNGTITKVNVGGTGSFFNKFYDGKTISIESNPASNVNVSGNSFTYTSPTKLISNTAPGGGTVNAVGNWWGTCDISEITSNRVTGSYNIEPFSLVDGSDGYTSVYPSNSSSFTSVTTNSNSVTLIFQQNVSNTKPNSGWILVRYSGMNPANNDYPDVGRSYSVGNLLNTTSSGTIVTIENWITSYPYEYIDANAAPGNIFTYRIFEFMKYSSGSISCGQDFYAYNPTINQWNTGTVQTPSSASISLRDFSNSSATVCQNGDVNFNWQVFNNTNQIPAGGGFDLEITKEGNPGYYEYFTFPTAGSYSTNSETFSIPGIPNFSTTGIFYVRMASQTCYDGNNNTCFVDNANIITLTVLPGAAFAFASTSWTQCQNTTFNLSEAGATVTNYNGSLTFTVPSGTLTLDSQSGTSVTATTVPTSGPTFSYTSTGLPQSFTFNIMAFSNACGQTSTSQNITLNVVPKANPSISNPSPVAVCEGVASSAMATVQTTSTIASGTWTVVRINGSAATGTITAVNGTAFTSVSNTEKTFTGTPASGTTSITYVPSPTDATAGFVVFKFIAANGGNCTGTQSVSSTLTVYPQPGNGTNLTINTTQNTICQYETTTVFATAYTGNTYTFFRSINGGAWSQIQSGSATFVTVDPTALILTSGTINYMIGYTNSNGCSNTTTSLNIYVNPRPTNLALTFGAGNTASICENATQQINSVLDAGVTNTWYESTNNGTSWNAIAPQPSGSFTVISNKSADGFPSVTFTYRLIKTNNTTGCTTTAAPSEYFYLKVNHNPSATLTTTMGLTTICEATTTSFSIPVDPLLSNPATTQYTLWHNGHSHGTVFGGGNPNVFIIPPTQSEQNTTGSGTYSIAVADGTTGCSRTYTHPVALTVFPLPQASNVTLTANGNTTFCDYDGQQVILTPQSAYQQNIYTWILTTTSATTSVGGTVVATNASASYTVSNPNQSGRYWITVGNPDLPTCTASTTFGQHIDVLVNPLPSATFSASSATICPTFTVSLALVPDQIIIPYTYTWNYNFNGGAFSSTTFSTTNLLTGFQLMNPGTYQFYAIVSTPSSCTWATTMATVTVRPFVAVDNIRNINGGTSLSMKGSDPYMIIGNVGGSATSGSFSIIDGDGHFQTSSAPASTVTMATATFAAPSGTFWYHPGPTDINPREYAIIKLEAFSSAGCTSTWTSSTISIVPSPTRQARDIKFTSENTSQTTVTYTLLSGNGNKTLVLLKPNVPIIYNFDNNNDYVKAGASTFLDLDGGLITVLLGDNNQTPRNRWSQDGTLLTGAVGGLDPTTKYFVRAYEYNVSGPTTVFLNDDGRTSTTITHNQREITRLAFAGSISSPQVDWTTFTSFSVNWVDRAGNLRNNGDIIVSSNTFNFNEAIPMTINHGLAPSSCTETAIYDLASNTLTTTTSSAVGVFANFKWGVNPYHDGCGAGYAQLRALSDGIITGQSSTFALKAMEGEYVRGLRITTPTCSTATVKWSINDLYNTPIVMNAGRFVFDNSGNPTPCSPFAAGTCEWFGPRKIVLARVNTPPTIPLDGKYYYAAAGNSQYGQGRDIGFDNPNGLRTYSYVIAAEYNGDGGLCTNCNTSNNVSITGLAPRYTYYVRVFGYRGGPAAGTSPTSTIGVTGNTNYHSVGSWQSFRAPSCREATDAVYLEFSNMEAYSFDKSVFTQWETRFERGIIGFNLYRADADNEDIENSFVKVGSYMSNNELIAGNNFSGSQYSFTDKDVSLQVGKSYVYKLTFVGADGEEDYIDEQVVKVLSMPNTGGALLVSEITPNPATNEISFTIDLPKQKTITIEIVDVSGKTVAMPYNNSLFNAGTNGIKINLSNELPSGMYMLNITSETEAALQKFVIVK